MKRRIVLSTVLLALLFALLPLLSGCNMVVGAETTATIDNADPDAITADAAIAALTQSPDIQTPPAIGGGILRAASDLAFPPLAYLATVDEVQGEETKKVVKAVGFEVDLGTAIAKKLGLTLEVASTEWDDVVPALLDDRVDLILSAMVVTPELEQEVAFADPHLASALAISSPLSAPVADAAGLVGKTVGVQEDTASHAYVMTVTGVAEVKTYSTIIRAFADLADGHIQAVMNDEIVSTYILDNDADLKGTLANTATIAAGGGYAFAMRKDDTVLLTALNAALAELRAEGVYQKICAKWDLTGN